MQDLHFGIFALSLPLSLSPSIYLSLSLSVSLSLSFSHFHNLTDAQQTQDSLESGVARLEQTVENLNLRLARLLAEYSASQAKLKQRISKLEDR